MNQKQFKYAKVQINKQKMTKSLKGHFFEKKYTDLLDKVELRGAELLNLFINFWSRCRIQKHKGRWWETIYA